MDNLQYMQKVSYKWRGFGFKPYYKWITFNIPQLFIITYLFI